MKLKHRPASSRCAPNNKFNFTVSGSIGLGAAYERTERPWLLVIFLAVMIKASHYRPWNHRIRYHHVARNVTSSATSLPTPPPARVGRLDTLPRCRREA